MKILETPEKLAKMIDHTNLKPDATLKDMEKLCDEAQKYGFATVCVNPANVKYASNLLEKTDIKVCTVIGFPFGANTSKIKFFEAKDAIASGASELDMVINIGALKSGLYDELKKDIDGVIVASEGAVVKVIIETGALTDEEIVKVSEIVKESGADFIKTSTGIGYPGARIKDIMLIRKTLGASVNVKASGGIKDLKTALDMIKAGATRIGTSSGIKIMEEMEKIRESQ